MNQVIENKVQFGITIPQGWRGGDLPLQQENDPVKQYEFSKSISIGLTISDLIRFMHMII